MTLLQRPSPNFSTNRQTTDYIILHGTWMDNDEEALTRLCDPKTEVSCHYFIDQAGKLYQLVAEENVAWHAGVSRWKDLESLNFHSLGIEISNPGINKGMPYHEVQYQTLENLLTDLLKRHNIAPENVLAHSDIAPDRKDDPGPHFNWERLAEKGLAVRPQ